ncbi:MAG: CRISPR-associated endonuclease Cas2 [Gammaproteobacteria bacterium]|nr:CRISPR-associated endonuclease Cas2 [Gammaproteobacteria bacterium]
MGERPKPGENPKPKSKSKPMGKSKGKSGDRLKRWYILAYDVRDSKRLRRLHYFLSREALSLQYSVFLVHKNKEEIKCLITEVKDRVETNVDDVRLYPVKSPNVIWASGKQSRSMSGLYVAGHPSEKKPKKKSFIDLLFQGLKKGEKKNAASN